MSDTNTILVVVDPTKDSHPALSRATLNVTLRKDEVQSKLLILLAVDPEVDNIDANNPNITRTLTWINEQLESIAKHSIEHEVFISWASNWARTAINLVNSNKADMVMVPYYGNVKKHVLSDEKWKLLRKVEVPTILVSPNSDEMRNVILASIRSQEPSYAELNQKVIKKGREGAKIYGAELHIVNAYKDSMDFPDRVKIAKMADIPNEQVHVVIGSPATVIHDLSEKIHADTVLIGNNRRKGLKGKLRGNTIEKIVEHLGRDVVMI